ncbi:cytochrome P450 [Saccharothrix deserti]|uniref:cytochrome P450 n=1 Tax=Saccharothrix deserti TaxID=2593674 RepID=UPI00131E716D|nr:cytochrome P450 [Saccharothrix deserti]
MRMSPLDSDVPDAIDLDEPARYAGVGQHAAWRWLRDHAPLWLQSTRSGHEFWSVTRYDDVVRVLKEIDVFSSEWGTILAVAGGDLGGGTAINMVDPPLHADLRGPTARVMSMSVMRARAARIRDDVRSMLEPVPDGEPVDLADVLLELPMVALGGILGVPRSRWRDVGLAAMRGVAPDDPAYTLGDARRTLTDAHSEIFDLFGELVARRRAEPTGDLVSALCGLTFDGRPLDDQEVVLNCYSFLMGAATTTPHVAAHFIAVMAEEPALWHTLRARPDLRAAAVEEAARWTSPTNHLLRRVTRPVELRGRVFEPGELVCAWVASANRDERVFTDPYRFRLDRAPNPHIAFSVGPHYCIGAPAARAALGALVNELAERVVSFEPVGDAVHVRSNFINGVSRLPMRLVTR